MTSTGAEMEKIDSEDIMQKLAQRAGYDGCQFLLGSENAGIAFVKEGKFLGILRMKSNARAWPLGTNVVFEKPRGYKQKEWWKKALEAVVYAAANGNYVYFMDVDSPDQHGKEIVVLRPRQALEEVLVELDLMEDC